MNVIDGDVAERAVFESQVREVIIELTYLRCTIRDARRLLERIVCTEGSDRGVVLLSNDSPTHYDPAAKGQVYDHENFSPLGDALIELHGVLRVEESE